MSSDLMEAPLVTGFLLHLTGSAPLPVVKEEVCITCNALHSRGWTPEAILVLLKRALNDAADMAGDVRRGDRYKLVKSLLAPWLVNECFGNSVTASPSSAAA